VSTWYYHKDLKPQGPLSFEALKKKILRGEIAPTDLVIKVAEKDQVTDWRAACEWRDFPSHLFPAFQKNYFKVFSPLEKEWILLAAENEVPRQEGPYSAEDIQNFLLSGKVHLEDYVWRSGLTGWVQVRDRSEFFATGPTSRDL
jgi:hypothetical protein